MKEEALTILSNEKVGLDVYLMKLQSQDKLDLKAGQFAELKIDKFYLRRPISIFEFKDNQVGFLYKVLGKGTKAMSQMKKGETIDTILGLGNGFDLSKSNKPLLIGGGIGIAPLYQLGKELKALNKEVTFLFGFKNKDEIIMIDEFSKIGNVIITTDDGSYSYKGNPLSYLKDNQIDFDYYYACGPLVMLKFLSSSFANGEVSLEARMGCGFGACMGCSIKTTNGFKRVCKEGPVFKASEVIYE